MTFFPPRTINYRYYKPDRQILGKTMADHLRIAVCFWHTFCWQGSDMFGLPVFERPWTTPQEKIRAAFEFIELLGVNFFTFHDVDVAPPGTPLSQAVEWIGSEMERSGIELLWGTANLTGNPAYMAGAATNPDPAVFVKAVAQVKETLDATRQLQGHNYVLWGGREGYETLLNTDLKQEMDQLGRFLSMLVDYKHKTGFKGTLLIEPKPHEPSKHQYDFDTATVYAFLQKYGLENEFKVNIESNHATLAGHTLGHEVAYACANCIFGSIDANDGDLLLGWDTDQFPSDVPAYTYAIYTILQHGGFTTGGFNLDAKVRRQSIDLDDLVYGHVRGIETLAKALIHASKIIEEGKLANHTAQRYAGWQTGLGRQILDGAMTFEQVAEHASGSSATPQPRSGRQEWLEYYVDLAGEGVNAESAVAERETAIP